MTKRDKKKKLRKQKAKATKRPVAKATKATRSRKKKTLPGTVEKAIRRVKAKPRSGPPRHAVASAQGDGHPGDEMEAGFPQDTLNTLDSDDSSDDDEDGDFDFV